VGTVEQLLEDRGRSYDEPLPNHQRIAGHWSLILGHEVTAHQVALCMVAVKLARESFRHKADNCDDGEAYFRIANLIAEADLS
jgi:hypothetical protein